MICPVTDPGMDFIIETYINRREMEGKK